MKRLFFFVFACFILIKPAIPFIEFALDKDFILSELCEQKDEEVNTCNGQCHLMSQIEQYSDDLPFENNNQKTEKTEILFFDEPIKFEFSNFFNHKKNAVFFTDEQHYSNIFIKIPYPPPNFI